MSVSADNAKARGGKVLVHCFAGVSRSASVTIAYFIHSYHMTVNEAYEAVRTKRGCISPNLNFLGQLQSFYESVSASWTSPLMPRSKFVVGSPDSGSMRSEDTASLLDGFTLSAPSDSDSDSASSACSPLPGTAKRSITCS